MQFMVKYSMYVCIYKGKFVISNLISQSNVNKSYILFWMEVYIGNEITKHNVMLQTHLWDHFKILNNSVYMEH